MNPFFRRDILLMAIALGALATNGASAQPRGDAKLINLLRTTAAPAIYASPAGLPRFGYSYAVVINNWTDTKTLPRIYAPDDSGGHAEQTAAILKELDRELEKLGVTKGRVVRLQVLMKGVTFKQTLQVTDVLDQYFVQRVLQKGSTPEAFDQPTRNIDGVKELDPANPKRLVAIEATILDPETATTEMISDISTGRVKARSLTPNGARKFLIDAVSAQRTDFRFEGKSAEQIAPALRNFDLVLASIGAKKSDVKQIDAIYVPEDGIQQEQIARGLKSYFGTSMPKVQFRPVQMSGIPGGTVCFSAMGSVVYPAP